MENKIKEGLKQYLPIFRDAQKKKLNEADTVNYLTRFFSDVLGYDFFKEITQEQKIRSSYVDIALKAGSEVKILVEAKAVGIKLRDSHAQQAQNYAANLPGVDWVLLTNGIHYIMYHIELEEAIEATEVFNIDLFNDSIDEVCKYMAMIHRKKILGAKDLKNYWKKQKALLPDMVLKALSSETVLKSIAKELKSLTGHRVSVDDILEALRSLIQENAPSTLSGFKVRRKPRPVKTEEKKVEREEDSKDKSIMTLIKPQKVEAE